MLKLKKHYFLFYLLSVDLYSSPFIIMQRTYSGIPKSVQQTGLYSMARSKLILRWILCIQKITKREQSH